MNFKSIALVAIIFLSSIGTTNAKKKNIESQLKVAGNCGSCENRIEKAAYSAGAKSASWDSQTQILTVIYNPKKASLENIQTEVLNAGHDVENEAAPDSVYNTLPGCCKFRDTECTDH